MLQNNASNLKNCFIAIFLKFFSNTRSKTLQKIHNNIEKEMTTKLIM